MVFREELAHKLPLPLARLYRRAYNAKSAKDRHDNAYFLFEVFLKVSSTAVISCYIRHGTPDPGINQSLKALSLPSAGHWRSFLGDILKFFGKAPDAGLHRIKGLHDGLMSTRQDLPLCLEAYNKLYADVREKERDFTKFKLMDFFDLMVGYRNVVLGHGAVRETGFYERNATLIFNAMGEIMEHIDALFGGQLQFVSDVHIREDGRRECPRMVLNGDMPVRATAYVTDEEILPRRLYLFFDPGEKPLCLHPLMIYLEGDLSDDVYILNKNDRDRKVQYLSYTTGRIFTSREFAEDHKALLEKIAGEQVDKTRDEDIRMRPAPDTREAAPRTEPEGRLIGDFDIIEEIGHGGMGVVYKARQLSLNRTVALKLLPSESAKDEVRLARFKREIAALGGCDHPNIVKIISSGESQGVPFYTMEYIEGASLKEIFEALSTSNYEMSDESFRMALSGGNITDKGTQASEPASFGRPKDRKRVYYDRVARIGRDTAFALQYVHDKGIIHRDVKPGNIMATADGERVVLMDFGLSGHLNSQSLTSDDAQRLMGTLRYASPQQVMGSKAKLDHRTDIYSLGATMYELLALKPIYEAQSEVELLNKVVSYETKPDPIHLSNSAVPDDLATIVHKCIEKEPERRYSTAEDLGEDLEHFLKGEPISARPPGMGYMMKLWLRRHKALVSSVTAVIILGIIGTVIAFNQIKRQRDRALSAEKTALQQKTAAEKNFLESQKNLSRSYAQIAQVSYLRNEWGPAMIYSAESMMVHPNALAMSIYFDSLSRQPRLLTRLLTPCKTLKWSPDGKLLATGGSNDKVRIWNPGDMKIMFALGQETNFDSMAWSPDGKRMALGGYDGTITVWDTSTGERLSLLRGHEDRITSIDWSPDGGKIASGSRDGMFRIWNISTKEKLMEFGGFGEEVASIVWSPDGNKIAAGGGRLIRIWGSATWNKLSVLANNEAFITSIAWSPDARRIAAGGRGDGAVRVWDVSTGKQTALLKGFESWVTSVSWSSDGQRIAAGGDSSVRIWQTGTWEELAALKGDTDWVTSVSWSPDGVKIASGGRTDTVWIWDAGPSDKILQPAGKRGWVTSVSWNPNDRWIASADNEGTIRISDARDGREIGFFRHKDSVNPVPENMNEESPNPGNGTDSEGIWDTQTGNRLVVMSGNKEWVASISWSPDGNRLASGGYDKTIRVWDASSRKQLAAMQGNEDWVNSVSWSPDGKKIASAGEDKAVRIWDADGGRELNEFKGHESGVRSVAWSPAGNKIVSGGQDMTVRLWDANTGKELLLLRGHKGWVTSVTWSPDGGGIASASRDGTVRVWDAAKGGLLNSFAHNAGVNAVSWSPDGKKIASGGEDGAIRIWDTETGELYAVLMKHEQSVLALSWSPDGNMIASGSMDRKLLVWDVSILNRSSQELMPEAERITGLKLDEFKIVPKSSDENKDKKTEGGN